MPPSGPVISLTLCKAPQLDGEESEDRHGEPRQVTKKYYCEEVLLDTVVTGDIRYADIFELDECTHSNAKTTHSPAAHVPHIEDVGLTRILAQPGSAVTRLSLARAAITMQRGS